VLGIEEARIGIIGLGYVGLPLAVEFGKKMPTVGFDINADRISELKRGKDSTLELDKAEMAEAARLGYTDKVDLRNCNVFIVTVPTPIDRYKRPDLSPLESASRMLGKILKRGDVVIFESTVYPGATEEVCVPIMESVSGLTFNKDFFAGYSPERINPGDKEHRVSNILKGGSRGFCRCPVPHCDQSRYTQGQQHQGGRGIESDREHATRYQYIADQ